MTRSISILLLCISFATAAFCQQPIVQLSGTYDMHDGWYKVLQLKNGNTAFFRMNKKEGLVITIFDNARKEIVHNTVNFTSVDNDKIKSTVVAGLYEVSGEAVLFIMQPPYAYRLRFNGSNGLLIKEDDMGKLAGLALLNVSSDGTNILVKKDPHTDCYAVLFVNRAATASNEQIKVAHFDGTHRLLSAVAYTRPETGTEKMELMDAVVDSAKKVLLTTYTATTDDSKGAQIFIAALNAGDTAFLHKRVDIGENFQYPATIMRYNHSSNTVIVLLQVLTGGKNTLLNGSKNYYSSILCFIDAETLLLKNTQAVTLKQINDYAHNKLGLKTPYRGLAQQLLINKDQSIVVLSEEMAGYSPSTYGISGGAVSTQLGNIGITNYNAEGMEQNAYFIPKLQLTKGPYAPMYMATANKSGWNTQAGYTTINALTSFDYINTGKSSYTIFNDNTNNYNKEDYVGRDVNLRPGNVNAISYKLEDNNVSKSYLFTDPDKTGIISSAMIYSSDYDANTNVYATVMVQKINGNKTVRVAWVVFP